MLTLAKKPKRPFRWRNFLRPLTRRPRRRKLDPLLSLIPRVTDDARSPFADWIGLPWPPEIGGFWPCCCPNCAQNYTVLIDGVTAGSCSACDCWPDAVEICLVQQTPSASCTCLWYGQQCSHLGTNPFWCKSTAGTYMCYDPAAGTVTVTINSPSTAFSPPLATYSIDSTKFEWKGTTTLSLQSQSPSPECTFPTTITVTAVSACPTCESPCSTLPTGFTFTLSGISGTVGGCNCNEMNATWLLCQNGCTYSTYDGTHNFGAPNDCANPAGTSNWTASLSFCSGVAILTIGYDAGGGPCAIYCCYPDDFASCDGVSSSTFTLVGAHGYIRCNDQADPATCGSNELASSCSGLPSTITLTPDTTHCTGTACCGYNSGNPGPSLTATISMSNAGCCLTSATFTLVWDSGHSSSTKAAWIGAVGCATVSLTCEYGSWAVDVTITASGGNCVGITTAISAACSPFFITAAFSFSGAACTGMSCNGTGNITIT